MSCKKCGQETRENANFCEECIKSFENTAGNGYETKGRKFWEGFGKSLDLAPRLYFDFVKEEKYEELLKNRDLRNKRIIDLGAGYPPPQKGSPEKKLLPLAPELQETLEQKGAKLIAVDVATAPLEAQKKRGRETILAGAFQLPFQNESIDGGCIILNLFNSSFKTEEKREVFMTIEECEKILREVYRVLQRGCFVVISNYGYVVAKLDNLVKMMGPEQNEVVTLQDLKNLAEKIGFTKTEDIPLDVERTKLGEKLMVESFPEALRDRIELILEAPGALFIEK